ncbi:hypothetical protein RFF05_09830 [Bengtsoniella intestinalis]|uniref:hypothetical protein n=1 Tax=Bengtsoniella intestinalis TaxID=3073143 RepID=UPI00391F0FA4
MITIKKPIALHTAMTLSCDTGGFAQRMQANYAMMGTTVKPKELLFYVTAPMELPEEWMGAQTSLQLSTHVQNNQVVSLSVTNNLINRILLEHNTPFTYQDTVYISSVLRQLGVEEVSHFMSEVRRLRKEQMSAHTISKLYQKVNHTEQILQTLLRQERETLGQSTQQEPQGTLREGSQDNYLFQHIFNRLDSKTIYQGVHAFQGHIRQSEFNPTQEQLRLTEHIRTSQALERTELRTNLLGKQQLTLEHVINLYEQGDGLPLPQSQEQVLNQITQATVMHMVTQALSQELVYNKVQKQQWVNFERTIAQMAEHSLARYEQFHSQPISHSHHHAQHTAVQQAVTAVEIEQLQSLLQWSQTYAQTTATTLQTPAQTAEHIIHVQHPQMPEGQDQTIAFQMPEGEVRLSQFETTTQHTLDRQTTHHETEMEHQRHQQETITQTQQLLRLTAEKETRQAFQKLTELHVLDRGVEQLWQRETTLSPTLINLFGQWYAQTVEQGSQTYSHHQQLRQQIIKTDSKLAHRVELAPQTEEELLEQLTQTLVQSAIHQHRDHITDQYTQQLTNLVEQSYYNRQQLTQNQWVEQGNQSHSHHQQLLQQMAEEQTVLTHAMTVMPQTEQVLLEQANTILEQTIRPQIAHTVKVAQVTQRMEQLVDETYQNQYQSRLTQNQLVQQAQQRHIHQQQVLQKMNQQVMTQIHEAVKALEEAQALSPQDTYMLEQHLLQEFHQKLRQEQVQRELQALQPQTHIHTQQDLQWVTQQHLSGEEVPLADSQEDLIAGGAQSLTQVTNTQIDRITKLSQVTEQMEQVQQQTDTHLHQSDSHSQQMFQSQPELRTTYYQQLTQELERIQQENTQRYHTIQEQTLWEEQKGHPQATVPLTFAYSPQEELYPNQGQQVEPPAFLERECVGTDGATHIQTSQVSQQQTITQEEHYAQIAQSVQMIEQQNAERLQILQEQGSTEEKGFATTKADALRTLTHAHKALEDPEVVQELQGAPQVPTQTAMPPQLMKIMEQADPQQQALFQQVFQMGQSPQLRPQGMQAADVAALKRDIQQAERDWSDPVQMAHPNQEDGEDWQENQVAAEGYTPLAQTYGQFAHIQTPGTSPRKVSKTTKSTMVHRQENSFQTLLEEMEERYTQQVLAQQQTVHTMEQTHTQNIHTRQINHQEVQHQVEDISNLVRTTLSGQMSYITDQVYQQMERRLEMERSRRGR